LEKVNSFNKNIGIFLIKVIITEFCSEDIRKNEKSGLPKRHTAFLSKLKINT